ncbi:FadR/GntR family transcriptional regulator [Lentzea sp. NPDC092896]|uniref:FadR/GntR family transcriptional regulator n=1 Tax=Lentzea sp. NPDC092896 TaxID=3364127 RepID=UPI003814AD8D
MSSKRSRSDDAVDWMRDQILSGTWPLNSRIPTQAQTAATSGFSFAIIRQVTSLLIGNGMLESASGRGTYVRDRSAVTSVLLDHLHDQPPQWTLALRHAMEVEAAGLAATNRAEIFNAIERRDAKAAQEAAGRHADRDLATSHT